MGKLIDISVGKFNELAGKMRKQVDFYYWKGIPCIRRWPRKFRGTMGPAQSASAAAWKNIAERKPDLPPEVKENFKKLAAGSTYTWSDLYTAWRLGEYKGTGLMPPEVRVMIQEFKTNNPDLIVGTDEPGKLYLTPILGKTFREYQKEYRGTIIKCRRPIPKTLNKGYRIPIKITGKGPWKVAAFAGYSRSLTKYYTRDTAENIYNKLVADLPAESYISSGNRTARVNCVLHSAPGPGLPYRGGTIGVSRIEHNLPLDIPACWTPEDVNGITFDVVVGILHPPEYYKVSTVMTEYGDWLRWKDAIRKNITFPFTPGVAGSHLISFTPAWYSTFPPPGINKSEPNPYAYSGSFQVLRYRFTKGPWHTYEWSFKVPLLLAVALGLSIDDESVTDFVPVIDSPGLQALDPGEEDEVKAKFEEEVVYQEERAASDFEMQSLPWSHDYY